MRQGGAEVEARNTMTSPCSAGLRCLVNKDGSASRSDGMGAEIELGAREAVVRGDS